MFVPLPYFLPQRADNQVSPLKVCPWGRFSFSMFFLCQLGEGRLPVTSGTGAGLLWTPRMEQGLELCYPITRQISQEPTVVGADVVRQWGQV